MLIPLIIINIMGMNLKPCCNDFKFFHINIIKYKYFYNFENIKQQCCNLKIN